MTISGRSRVGLELRDAAVTRLDPHDHAVRIERRHERIGDLLTEPLLQLWATTRRLDDANDTAEAGEQFAGGDEDVDDAVERHEVVLAHRSERDSEHAHELTGVGLILETDRVSEGRGGIAVEICEQVEEQICEARRRADETRAVHVLAERIEQLAHRRHGPDPIGRPMRAPTGEFHGGDLVARRRRKWPQSRRGHPVSSTASSAASSSTTRSPRRAHAISVSASSTRPS